MREAQGLNGLPSVSLAYALPGRGVRPWLLVRLTLQKAACPPTDPTTASPSSAHDTTATREASRP